MNVLYLNLDDSDCQIHLPSAMNLKGKGVGLIDINGYYNPDKAVKNLFLCCDFIEENSIICQSNCNLVLPVLRQLNFKFKNATDLSFRIKEVYNKILFLPCNRDEVDTVRMYLADEEGKVPSFNSCDLKCSLLIYQPEHQK